MQLEQPGDLPVSSDFELIETHLPLDNANLLELGCGAAFTTRRLAETFPIAHIVAAEVDQTQHEKNLAISDLPKVSFKLAGMEDIPEPDASFDAVIMLKSLHHVPLELLPQGFKEIRRVLKPGGLLYISEPVFAGEFNEILRLFNDEQHVRQAAFEATRSAVNQGRFRLKQEIHFISQSRFNGFADFENRILNATHSEFNVDEALYDEIKKRFLPYINAEGIALFNNPMRVDILQKS